MKPQLTGIAREILEKAELIGTKTVFAMYMPPGHEQLLIPSAIKKAEEYLSEQSNGVVEIVFQTDSNYKVLQ